MTWFEIGVLSLLAILVLRQRTASSRTMGNVESRLEAVEDKLASIELILCDIRDNTEQQEADFNPHDYP